MSLLRFILVGFAAGWIMGKIRRGRGYGLLGNLVVGAVGSLVGWFLMGLLQISTPNLFIEITMAVAGAVVFFFLVGTLRWKRKKKAKDDED